MTWEERAKAGVPPSKFQTALKAKQSAVSDSPQRILQSPCVDGKSQKPRRS